MARKVAPKTAEPRPTPAEKSIAPRAATKAEVYTTLAEKSGLSKKEVAIVFTAMGDLIGRELGKKGPGEFVVPGLLKL
ncbi:MAG: DNA-binding protein, partial [Planctomycetia bacterium]|nr:DNA-binding protein [Planctomycetia bacterium]